MSNKHHVDYYRVLGVAPTSSRAEIRAAYRKLALETHPDKGGAANAFRMVNDAYVVLDDPEKRAGYDIVLSRGPTNPSGRVFPGAPGSPKRPETARQYAEQQRAWHSQQWRWNASVSDNDQQAHRKRSADYPDPVWGTFSNLKETLRQTKMRMAARQPDNQGPRPNEAKSFEKEKISTEILQSLYRAQAARNEQLAHLTRQRARNATKQQRSDHNDDPGKVQQNPEYLFGSGLVDGFQFSSPKNQKNSGFQEPMCTEEDNTLPNPFILKSKIPHIEQVLTPYDLRVRTMDEEFAASAEADFLLKEAVDAARENLGGM